MIQPELPLPGISSMPDPRRALIVGDYRSVYEFVTQSARQNLGTVVLGFAQQGMGTLLGAVARGLSTAGGSFMYRCCPEQDSFNQIATFTNRIAPGMSPRRKTAQCHAEHLDVCVQRILFDQFKFLIVHRVDLASDPMLEFLEGLFEDCQREGHMIVPIVGQRVTHSSDPIRYQSAGRMPLNITLPPVELRTVLPFISEFCSGGQTIIDVVKRGDGAAAKAIGRLVNHCDGLMAKLVQFCNVKEALFPGVDLTAAHVDICVDCLKEPMKAFELMARANRNV